jgi:hypothetical protein
LSPLSGLSLVSLPLTKDAINSHTAGAVQTEQ